MTLRKLSSKRVALSSSLALACLLFVGVAGQAHAQSGCDNDCFAPITPEIDPSLGPGGLALVGGVILIVRSRRAR